MYNACATCHVSQGDSVCEQHNMETNEVVQTFRQRLTHMVHIWPICISMCPHTCAHTHACAHTHIRMHVRTRTFTRTHTYTHTTNHTHTYTYTHQSHTHTQIKQNNKGAVESMGTELDRDRKVQKPMEHDIQRQNPSRLFIGVFCWLLPLPPTCNCCSGMDLLRHVCVLPH